MPRTLKHQQDLLERLEALHLIILDIDAFYGACEEWFHRLPWKSSGDPALRRDLNRLDCFVHQTSVTIAKLVDESRATLRVAITRRTRKRGDRGGPP